MSACPALETRTEARESEIHMAIIAAAVAAALGSEVRICGIRELGAEVNRDEWVRLGRMQIDNSHNLRELYRSMPDRENTR